VTVCCNYSFTGTLLITAPDLVITKTNAVAWGTLGGLAMYTIHYRNVGSADAQDVVLLDNLASGVQWHGDTAETVGWTRAMTTPQVAWSTPTLRAGFGGSFQLLLRAPDDAACGDVLTNSVVITTTTAESDASNNWSIVTDPAYYCPTTDITCIKDDNVGSISLLHALLSADKLASLYRLLYPAPRAPLAATPHREFVYEGDIVTYTIAVSNTSLYTATNVVLTETLPQYTSYLGIGWTPVNSRTFTQAVGALLPGDGRIYYFVVQVADALPDGVDNLVNLVCSGSDEYDTNPDDNCNYEDTPVRRQPLQVEKSAPVCIAPGDVFDYRITYRRVAAGTALYSIRLTDTLPAYVSYVGGPDWNCVGQVCSYQLGPATLLLTNSLLLPVQLDAAFSSTLWMSITNVVEIQAGNRFELVTPIDVGPDLVLVKNDNVGPLPLARQAQWDAMTRRLSGARPSSLYQTLLYREFVRPGELITYTIHYLNEGIGAATGVVLTETLPENTSYVGGGWTPAGGQQYTLDVGTVAPGAGDQVQFIARVNDPFPLGIDRVINQVDIGGDIPECDASNNRSTDDAPVRTGWNLYVANQASGSVDVFNTTDFGYITSVTLGGNPFGMTAHDHYLFVVDFAADESQGRLYVVDTLINTMVYSITVGSHPANITTDGEYVYIASHSSPPAITIVRAGPPWNKYEVNPVGIGIEDFGFFGATFDSRRGLVYFTKRDLGGIGIWRLAPPGSALLLDYVYATDESNREKPNAILYYPRTDRVYVAFGLIDELWVFDPDGWQLLERIATGIQDPVDPGFGGHGLAALGGYVFVSNYGSASLTTIYVGGSALPGLPIDFIPLDTLYKIYLPLASEYFTINPRVSTISLGNRQPQGIAGVGNLFFVTLPFENTVLVIDMETFEIIDEIQVHGSRPHTVILIGGNQ
jgi:uncharacterized repeat protein (TIGR01451 family)